jgi:hypothetical protein
VSKTTLPCQRFRPNLLADSCRFGVTPLADRFAHGRIKLGRRGAISRRWTPGGFLPRIRPLAPDPGKLFDPESAVSMPKYPLLFRRSSKIIAETIFARSAQAIMASASRWGPESLVV